jgi:hypothetical protein
MLEHRNRTCISKTKSIQLQQYNIFSATIFHIYGRSLANPSCAALLATFWPLWHSFVPLGGSKVEFFYSLFSLDFALWVKNKEIRKNFFLKLILICIPTVLYVQNSLWFIRNFIVWMIFSAYFRLTQTSSSRWRKRSTHPFRTGKENNYLNNFWVMRPCAARTRLFRFINTQNGELCALPCPSQLLIHPPKNKK